MMMVAVVRVTLVKPPPQGVVGRLSRLEYGLGLVCVRAAMVVRVVVLVRAGVGVPRIVVAVVAVLGSVLVIVRRERIADVVRVVADVGVVAVLDRRGVATESGFEIGIEMFRHGSTP